MKTAISSLTEKGIPQTETDENKRLANPIGNIQPKMTMSVSPTFTYKGVTLSAMFDMKFGGDIFSYSEMLATGNGLAKRTINRGEDNGYMMVFPGVYADGQRIQLQSKPLNTTDLCRQKT